MAPVNTGYFSHQCALVHDVSPYRNWRRLENMTCVNAKKMNGYVIEMNCCVCWITSIYPVPGKIDCLPYMKRPR